MEFILKCKRLLTSWNKLSMVYADCRDGKEKNVYENRIQMKVVLRTETFSLILFLLIVYLVW